MPDYISHSLFADEAISEGSFSVDGDGLDSLFRLGAQGADLLNYCDYCVRDGGFSAASDMLHEVKASDVKDYVMSNARSAEENAYLMGYLAHYVLDEEVHPFVYKRAAELSDSLNISDGCAHVMLESMAEAKELFDKRGIIPRQYEYARELPRRKERIKLVARLNNDLLRAFGFPGVDSEKLPRAISRLGYLFSFIFDRSGAVRKIFDLKYSLTRKDSELRWHIKCPFRADFVKSAFRGDEFSHMEKLSRLAKTKFKKALIR